MPSKPKTTTLNSPKKTPAKKPPTKAPARKAPAAKTPAAKRSVRPAAKKAPVKKAAAKNASSKAVKAPAKAPVKAPTRKPPAKKAPAKAAPAKAIARPAAKKTAARRPTAAALSSGLLSRALRDLYATYRVGLAPIWHPATGLTVTMKVPASTSLYPHRTRCKQCAHSFGDLVVLRMFCSYRCAGLPDPDTNPDTAPRMCKRAARSDEHGEWVLKNKFVTEQDAARYLRDGTVCYRCANCFFLHIGNSSPAPQHGLPPVQTGTDVFADAVSELLRTRGEAATNPAAFAAAKRDVRTVLQVVEAHRTAGGRPRR